MTTAFVLAGGASLGSIQVGMLRALFEADVCPDLLVGTSVGALNAAIIAGQPALDSVHRLSEIWRAVRRADVFPAGPWRGTLGLLGRRNALMSPAGLERLLRAHIGFARLEEACIPLHVVTADVQTGLEHVVSTGSAVEAVLASAAIPGVFPPVSIEGRILMDGGVANNTPISHAVSLGATDVYVLPTGHACSLPHPPASALGMALQAFSVIMSQRLALDAGTYRDVTRLHILPPLCPLGVSPANFSHSADLMERAYRSTMAWLKHPSNAASEMLLKPHAHVM